MENNGKIMEWLWVMSYISFLRDFSTKNLYYYLYAWFVCLSVSYLLLNHWADPKNIWHAYSPQPWEGLEKIKFGIGEKKFFFEFFEIFWLKNPIFFQFFILTQKTFLAYSEL